jgi:hypothetical protein
LDSTFGTVRQVSISVAPLVPALGSRAFSKGIADRSV